MTMNKVNHLETIFASDQSWRESPNKDINLDLPPDLFTSRSTNPKGRNLQNTNRRRAITNSPVARMKGDKGCNEHDNIVSLFVPFFIVKRGGRKEIQMPGGIARPGRVDSTLIKALARAFRWKRMLESGEFATITELAEYYGITSSYVTRVLRLTLLAPDVVERILESTGTPEISLVRMHEPFPAAWSEQTWTDVAGPNRTISAAIGC